MITRPTIGDAVLESGWRLPERAHHRVAEVVGRLGGNRYFVYCEDGSGFPVEPVELAGKGVWQEVPLGRQR